MHRGHHHDHESGGSAGQPAIASIGHNQVSAPARPAQWQVLHGEPKPGGSEPSSAVTDLDLVEAAFAEGFLAASDPTSFLRLARVPFQGITSDGAKLALLRVEIDSVADVGAITPHLGGGTVFHHPLSPPPGFRRPRPSVLHFAGARLAPARLAGVIP